VLSEEFRELSTFLPKVADLEPERTAMMWPDRRISYSQLEDSVSSVAGWLEEKQLRPHGVVAAFMENSSEFVVLWLATVRVGGLFLPLNTSLSGDLLSFQLSSSRPDFLFVDEELLPVVNVVSRKSMEVFTKTKIQELESRKTRHVPFRVAPSEPAVILYTSGTTGPPKGVMLPHYAFANRVHEIVKIVRLTRQDVFYNALPLFHTSGQVMTTLPALMNGVTVVMEERFHANRFWSRIAEEGVSVTFILNRMAGILLRSAGTPSRLLRVVMSGGVRRDMQRLFYDRFGVRLLEGFGMTETCGIALYNTLDENLEGSVGKPLPSVEVRLSQDRERGELLLRPKVPFTMFLGYLGENDHWQASEWFHTGDMLERNAAGFYFYIERLKDVIRSRGENISPGYIEAAVETFPGVVECAAVGVTGELGDEDIMIAVKADPGVELPALFHHLESRLPYFMLPRYVLFLEELPRTPTQKIKREAVRALGVSGATDLERLGLISRRSNQKAG
jgi:crotonobetaine/carnitine-CoA ligase